MRYLMVGLAIGLAASVLLPALTNDANLREVGVQWVNNYQGHGDDLAKCGNDATRFYNELGDNAGFTRVFNWGDHNAWERDFKCASHGGNDHSYIDAVDIAYFSGHGSESGISFAVAQDYRRFSHTHARWGDQDLEWIALSACQTLREPGVFDRWGWPVFRGLHLLLGMHNNMYDTSNNGRYFARCMRGSRLYPNDGTKRTVRGAWRRATWVTQTRSRYSAVLGAAGAGGSAWNDRLPGYGTQVPDPYPIHYLWYIKYRCG